MMKAEPGSRYELCYLEAGRSVPPRFALSKPMADSVMSHAEPLEARWLVWGRSALAVTVVVVLVALALANVALYSRWHEVEDGVLWNGRPEGVTAGEVLPGSPAAAAGIERGDVLLAVNGSPVQTPADVVEYQHRSHAGTRLVYTMLRLGTQQGLQVALAPAPRGGSMYFVLAGVGLFTLLVGASVRLRRPRDQATLHFFWLCVAFFGVFSFSFNGPFDRLDWVLYWSDAIAFALLPPLLLHFTMVFPERPGDRESRIPNPESRVGPAARAVDVFAGPRVGRCTRDGRRARLGGQPIGSDVLARARVARSGRTDLSVRLRGGRARCAHARISGHHVGHGSPSAPLDRVGRRTRRRPVRLRLCPAMDARHQSTARAAAHGGAAGPRAADVCLGDRALSASRRRGHHQAWPRIHGVPGGEHRSVCRAAQAHRLRARHRRRRAQLDHRRAGDTRHRAARSR